MNGILLVDKEQDWTSNDVVSKLKGVLHERRIGHSGTLDPMATGLLVVFVGRATRAVEFAEGHDKRYIAGLRLGVTTDTQDISGNILCECAADVDDDALAAALKELTGDIMQIPPMYSAIKVNGRRLYDIARSGGEVERKARPVSIRSIELLGRENGDIMLDIRCSKGTYIRTLCSDIGAALGCGGCMSSLRRIEAGDYRVDSAKKISEIQTLLARGCIDDILMPTDSMFMACPEWRADAERERKIRCGNAVKAHIPDGEYRVYSENGEFLMLGRAENGMMRTIKSFFEVS